MKKKLFAFILVTVFICVSIPVVNQKPVYALSTVTVNLANEKQVISGFGGSSAWHGQLTDAEANSLFSTLGLSLLRIRIDPNGNWNDELINAQKASVRGAEVFASPWTPPAYMKDNNNVVGGSLLPAYYSNYAAWLKSFGDYMQNNGVTLRAISVQNEPNISVSYESCSWTSTQMRDFIRDFGSEIGYPVMAPETFNYLPSYADVILNDTAACNNIDIVAHHWYGANRHQYYANAFNKGKQVWMTEHYSDDQSLSGALKTAVDIHNFMTINYSSAYVWWYLRQPSCNLIQSGGTINPRGYILGQFAKFVRPGYVRVDATATPQNGVYISAYKDPSLNKVVIVAINSNTKSTASLQFNIQNGNATSVTPYVTSSTANMQSQSQITVTNGTFNATLGAQSITTFVQN